VRSAKALLVIAGALLIAVGCGGGGEPKGPLTHDGYQDEISGISGDAFGPAQLYSELVVGTLSQQDCAAKLADFQTQVGDLVERVAALQPPPDAATAQAAFVTAARQSVAQLGAIANEVAAGTLACGEALNAQLTAIPSNAQASAAIASLQASGYTVFGQ
jgi:hypothetical protein